MSQASLRDLSCRARFPRTPSWAIFVRPSGYHGCQRLVRQPSLRDLSFRVHGFPGLRPGLIFARPSGYPRTSSWAIFVRPSGYHGCQRLVSQPSLRDLSCRVHGFPGLRPGLFSLALRATPGLSVLGYFRSPFGLPWMPATRESAVPAGLELPSARFPRTPSWAIFARPFGLPQDSPSWAIFVRSFGLPRTPSWDIFVRPSGCTRSSVQGYFRAPFGLGFVIPSTPRPPRVRLSSLAFGRGRWRPGRSRSRRSVAGERSPTRTQRR